MLQGISDQLHSPIQVVNLITSGNQATSATAGSFTAEIPAGEVQGVFSTSLATSPQR